MKEFLFDVLPSNAEKTLLCIGGFCGGLWTYLFGTNEEIAEWLLALMVFDYLVGTWAAWHESDWNSTKASNGIIKKVLIFCIVALAHGVDVCIPGEGAYLQQICLFAFIVTEFGSIVENVNRIFPGVIPPIISNKLSKLKKKYAEDN